MVTLGGLLGRLVYGGLFVVVVPLSLAAWAVALAPVVPLGPAPAPRVGALVAAAGLVLLGLGIVDLITRGRGLPMNAFPPREVRAIGHLPLAAQSHLRGLRAADGRRVAGGWVGVGAVGGDAGDDAGDAGARLGLRTPRPRGPVRTGVPGTAAVVTPAGRGPSALSVRTRRRVPVGDGPLAHRLFLGAGTRPRSGCVLPRLAVRSGVAGRPVDRGVVHVDLPVRAHGAARGAERARSAPTGRVGCRGYDRRYAAVARGAGHRHESSVRS